MMKKLTYITSFLLTLVLLAVSLSSAAAANFDPGFETKSDSIYLVNLDTDTPVYQKNEREKRYPASVTKIMTYIVVAEQVKDLENTKVKVQQEVLDRLDGTGSSLSGLEDHVDEQLSVLDLLYCMMVSSGNDAALVLGDYVGNGNVGSFVELMNAKVKELGCKDTNFVNPHGLHDPNQYTTAYDMYKIAQYAISLPHFMEICNTTTYYINPDDDEPLVTSNHLIDPNRGGEYYYEYAKGIKTGTTDEAGFCLISTAVKDGVAYLCVALHAPCYDKDGNYTDNGAMLDSKQLYEWAFGNLALKKVVGEQTPICETKVNYAFNKDTLLLVPEYSFSTMVPVGDDKESVEIVPNVPKSVDTPVTKGQKIGTADIKYGGQKIASVNLVASESVDRSEFVYGATVIKNVITSPWFIGAAVLVLVLFIIYLIAVSMMGKKKKGNVKKFRDM
ncbi:MAG: D-alanyl-D-alanine carboxypeptidase family protein [Christensenellales bacterium]